MLDATNDANERTMDADGAGTAGILDGFRWLFATPSRMGNVMTAGTHAKLSNLKYGDKRAKPLSEIAHQCMTRYPKKVTWR